MEKPLNQDESMSNYKVHIDPSVNIPYSSYYIQGLYEVFGKKNIKFSPVGFSDLDRRNEAWSFDSYMPIVISKKDKVWKVIIDFGDDVPVRKNAYLWCDIYAKINYCPEITGVFSKVVPIPPSFGIKIWNPGEIFLNCILNVVRLKIRPHTSLTNHFRLYLSQLKALPLKQYEKKFNLGKGDSYIYFVSSLWAHQNCLEGTNLYRKIFMETCIKSGAEFEGGFLVLEGNHPQINEFRDLLFHKRYPLEEYVLKTKKSALVFNTPAVHNCHGWKLGQFLAMGKAIVTTPLQNRLPKELLHGENIHLVKDENELKQGIEKILKDQDYKTRLESGASNYYENFASPHSVIKHIMDQLETCNFAK